MNEKNKKRISRYCDKIIIYLLNLQKSFLSFFMHNTPQKGFSSLCFLNIKPLKSAKPKQCIFPDIDNANIVTFHGVTVDWPGMIIHCHACI